MAFDLMYCCRCYQFYHGLHHASKKDSLRAYTMQQLREKEEAQRRETIQALEDQIRTLDMQLSEYRSLSLLGVTVRQRQYGTGVVIAQKDENITVQFGDKKVSYIINSQYPLRPRFEEDDVIVAAYTSLAELRKKQETLYKELEKI